MNREIKFRAWDEHKARFTIENDLMAVSFEGTVEHCSDMGITHRNDLKLMQYTGLKDKNGVEIYEGDIVIELYRDHKAIPRTVVFEDGMYWLKGPNHTGSVHSMALGGSLADERQAQSEVIGNIYENPDLLKATA